MQLLPTTRYSSDFTQNYANGVVRGIFLRRQATTNTTANVVTTIPIRMYQVNGVTDTVCWYTVVVCRIQVFEASVVGTDVTWVVFVVRSKNIATFSPNKASSESPVSMKPRHNENQDTKAMWLLSFCEDLSTNVKKKERC